MIEWLIFLITLLIIFYWFLRLKYLSLFDRYNQLLNTKRSENVKHGQTWEQFVPFAKDFPFAKEDFKFLGKPVDGIVFGEDKISFVEIKTGSSGLNAKQKQVRDLVNDKKVEWKEIRY